MAMAMAMASIALKRASPRTSTRTKASGTASMVEQALQDRTYVLLDAPVSNHGARVRFVVYAKGVERDVQLLSPSALGGMRTPEYLKHNPFGKMPLLLTRDPETAIFESDAIARYLNDVYVECPPNLVPKDVESRAKMDMAIAIHDHHVSPIQGCMYRDYGEDVGRRAQHVQELNRCLDALEQVAVATPFLAGKEVSLADATWLPTFVFFEYILPAKFGWNDLFQSRPKLKVWWEAMHQLPAGNKVQEEVRGALQQWDEGGRWEKVKVTEHVQDKNHQWKF